MSSNLQFKKSSLTPNQDLDLITPVGTPLSMRMYHGGYEQFFNGIPVIEDSNEDWELAKAIAELQMEALSKAVRHDNVLMQNDVSPNGFQRIILAMEFPQVNVWEIGEKPNYRTGSEVILTKWGSGFKSPVHGHASGFMYENLLSGKLKVNTYRIVNGKERIVRLIETKIYEGPSVVISDYSKHDDGQRDKFIHNFEAITPCVMVHYLSEHIRDGIGNQFKVEWFEDVNILTLDDVERITTEQAMYLRRGDVVLVKSDNVPDFGEHFIVATGHNVVKEHGLRPQTCAFVVSCRNHLLDNFEKKNGVILLKLKEQSKLKFLAFHNYTLTLQQNLILS